MNNNNLFEWDKAIVARTGQRMRKQPTLSVGTGGFGRINKALITQYGLENKKYAKILFFKHPDKIVAGVIFVDTKEENAVTVTHYERNGSATFSFRGLFAEAGIKHEIITRSLKFIPKIQDYKGEKVFVVEIPLKK